MEPRPPRATIPTTTTVATLLAIVRTIDARIARLEADDDRRTLRAEAMLRKDKP